MRLAHGNASLRCDYCKTVVIVQPDDLGVRYLEQAANLACPVCAIPLWNATLTGVKIHACERCHGLLVAMEAFEALIAQLRDKYEEAEIPIAAEPQDLNRRTDCPSCRQRMDTHFYYGGGSAVISGCEHCSLNWLDGGVLLRIVRAPHSVDTEAAL